MNWLRLWTGVDGAIFFTASARILSSGIGVLTLFFISRFLSPTLQGYYYTFYSLIALQMFVELGLNFAVAQFASHEMANLSWSADRTLVGGPEAMRRLQSLMQFAVVWLSFAAIVMLVLLLPFGSVFFFSTPAQISLSLGANIPWSLLVLFSALNMIFGAFVSTIEGCGKVAEVALMRLNQSLFSAIALWTVLAIGGNLYAVAASSLVTLVVGVIWIWYRYRSFLQQLLFHRTHLTGMNWRKEIWPFQWRIAVSSMTGFFVSQSLGPILFVTHGPVVAGQLGMTMQIVGALNGIALAWISTKAPIYGQLIATKQTKALDTLFFRGLTQSLCLLLIGLSGFSLALLYLSAIESVYLDRFLPLHLVAILCIASAANHVVSSEAAYLRAHKQEPFMILSIIGGGVSTALALLLIPTFGGAGAVYSYVFTAFSIGLGGGTIIFLRMRKQWAGEFQDSSQQQQPR